VASTSERQEVGLRKVPTAAQQAEIDQTGNPIEVDAITGTASTDEGVQSASRRHIHA
jgi:hypothetical protein